MLLAIDTATIRASIALHDGSTVRGEYTWEVANRHTVMLMARIAQMLETAGVTAADLTAVGVCVGPGSYTGVRVGVAAALGIAAARQLPVAGVSTFDILVAAQPPDPRPLYVLFAAGRQRIGYAVYRWQEGGWRASVAPAIATPAELAQGITEHVLVVGEAPEQGLGALQALEEWVEFPPPARHVRRAGFLADLAWAQVRSATTPSLVEPVYIQ